MEHDNRRILIQNLFILISAEVEAKAMQLNKKQINKFERKKKAKYKNDNH